MTTSLLFRNPHSLTIGSQGQARTRRRNIVSRVLRNVRHFNNTRTPRISVIPRIRFTNQGVSQSRHANHLQTHHFTRLTIQRRNRRFLICHDGCLARNSLHFLPLSQLRRTSRVLPNRTSLKANFSLTKFKQFKNNHHLHFTTLNFTLSTPLTTTFSTLSLANRLHILLNHVNLLSHVTRIIRLTTHRPHRLFFNLHFTSNPSHVLSLLININSRPLNLLLDLFRGLLPLKFSLHRLLNMDLLRLFSLTIHRTSTITFLFPMVFIANSFTRLLFSISVITTNLLTHGTSGVFQRTSLTNCLRNRQATKLTHFRPRRQPSVLRIRRRNTINSTFNIQHVVLSVNMVNHSGTMTPLNRRAFRSNFNSNTTSSQLNAQPRFISRRRYHKKNPNRRILRIRRIQQVNQGVIISQLLITSISRSQPRRKRFKSLQHQRRRPTLRRVLRSTHNFRTSQLTTHIKPQGSRSVLTTIRLRIRQRGLTTLHPRHLLRRKVTNIFRRRPIINQSGELRTTILQNPTPFYTRRISLNRMVTQVNSRFHVKARQVNRLQRSTSSLTPLNMFRFTRFIISLRRLSQLSMRHTSNNQLIISRTLRFTLINHNSQGRNFTLTSQGLNINVSSSNIFNNQRRNLRALNNLPLTFTSDTPSLRRAKQDIILRITRAVSSSISPLCSFKGNHSTTTTNIGHQVLFFTIRGRHSSTTSSHRHAVRHRRLLSIRRQTFSTRLNSGVVSIKVLPTKGFIFRVRRRARLINGHRPPNSLTHQDQGNLTNRPHANNARNATHHGLFAGPIRTSLLLRIYEVGRNTVSNGKLPRPPRQVTLNFLNNLHNLPINPLLRLLEITPRRQGVSMATQVLFSINRRYKRVLTNPIRQVMGFKVIRRLTRHTLTLHSTNRRVIRVPSNLQGLSNRLLFKRLHSSPIRVTSSTIRTLNIITRRIKRLQGILRHTFRIIFLNKGSLHRITHRKIRITRHPNSVTNIILRRPIRIIRHAQRVTNRLQSLLLRRVRLQANRVRRITITTQPRHVAFVRMNINHTMNSFSHLNTRRPITRGLNFQVNQGTMLTFSNRPRRSFVTTNKIRQRTHRQASLSTLRRSQQDILRTISLIMDHVVFSVTTRGVRSFRGTSTHPYSTSRHRNRGSSLGFPFRVSCIFVSQSRFPNDSPREHQKEPYTPPPIISTPRHKSHVHQHGACGNVYHQPCVTSPYHNDS